MAGGGSSSPMRTVSPGRPEITVPETLERRTDLHGPVPEVIQDEEVGRGGHDRRIDRRGDGGRTIASGRVDHPAAIPRPKDGHLRGETSPPGSGHSGQQAERA